jgi:transcriptional regulator with XRE-family HTH domain
MESNPEFDDISESEKYYITAPVGVTVAVLETYGFRNIINQKGLLNGLVARALGRSTNSTSAKAFSQFIREDVENMMARGILTVGAGGLAEFETGAAQQAAEISIKEIYNISKDKDMFQTPNTWIEFAGEVLKGGAQEAVGGFVLSTPGAVVNAVNNKEMSLIDDDAFNMLKDMSTDSEFTTMYGQSLRQKVSAGEMTEAEAKQNFDEFNRIIGVTTQIPTDLNTADQKKALELLVEKQTLDEQIQGKDKNLVKDKTDRIKEIDAELVNMAERRNATYLRDGKFLSREQFIEQLEAATPEEITQGSWEATNDSEVTDLLADKFSVVEQEAPVEEAVAEEPVVEEPMVAEPTVEEVVVEEAPIAEAPAEFSAEDQADISDINTEIRELSRQFGVAETVEEKQEARSKLVDARSRKTAIESKYLEDVSQEEAGVPSPVEEGQAVVEGEPIEEAGVEEVAADRDVQAPEEVTAEEAVTEEVPVEEAVVEEAVAEDPTTGRRIFPEEEMTYATEEEAMAAVEALQERLSVEDPSLLVLSTETTGRRGKKTYGVEVMVDQAAVEEAAVAEEPSADRQQLETASVDAINLSDKAPQMIESFNSALSSIGAAPVNVYVVSDADMQNVTGSSSRAQFRTLEDGTSAVVVNADKASLGSLSHEMMHAYVKAVDLNSKQIVRFTNEVRLQLSKGTKVEKALANKLTAFQKEYLNREVYGKGLTLEDAVIAEEFLAEFVAEVKDGIDVQKMSLSTIERIRKAVVRILNDVLGLKIDDTAIKSKEEAFDFVNGFLDALEGRTELTVEINPEAAAVVNSKNPYEASRLQLDVPVGSRIANEPLKDARTIAIAYMESKGLKHTDGNLIRKIDKKLAKRISDAYTAMKNNPTSPEVAAAYKAMADETIEQYEAIIKGGYKVEVNNNEPYNNSNELIEDLRKNKNMRIFSTDSGFGDAGITADQRKDNPLLAETKYKDVNGRTLLLNDVFRFVHDFFGHAERGNGFGPIGEENAWDVHSRMYSPLARKALTAETRGQNSYVNFSGVNDEAFKLRDKGRALRKEGKLEEAQEFTDKAYATMKFAPQKVGLLPDEFVANPYLQEKEIQIEEQGESGEVGTISIPKEQIEVIDAPKASDDARGFVNKFVTDIDINELEGRNFVTNMYDYTSAGTTELGNGISIELLGGRNYVPLMLERNGKELGEVSNLAAFNSKSQAEGFIRNAKEGNADLFAPHSGTLTDSWQFQHHIFEELVKAVLDNKIMSKARLMEVFNEAIKSKEGSKAFKAFNEKNNSRLKNLNSFKKNPMKLVELLDAENNYSPNLRKALNQKIAASKEFQNAIGIKNLNQFYNLIADPLNQGVEGGEIMSFVEFDPNTFEVSKTKPGDPDHHPSFGWTVKAVIKSILQPNKYYKSYDLTNEYTKYNMSGPEVSTKADPKFAVSNVTSSAGAIPKVAKVEPMELQEYKNSKGETVRFQIEDQVKQEENAKETYSAIEDNKEGVFRSQIDNKVDQDVAASDTWKSRERNAFERFVDLTRRRIQDSYRDIIVIQEDIEYATGKPVGLDQDFRNAEVLMHGKAKSELDKTEDRIKDITSKIKKSGLSVDDVNELLYAMHAQERNRYLRTISTDIGKNLSRMRKTSGMTPTDVAQLLGISKEQYLEIEANKRDLKSSDLTDLLLIYGSTPYRFFYDNALVKDGSGMTDVEARKILAKYDLNLTSPDVSQLSPKIRTAVTAIRELIADTRNRLVESGLESQGTIDAFNATYKNYVPLRGFADEQFGSEFIEGGGKLEVRARERRAKGRQRKADSPLTQAIISNTTTIIRGAKNDVMKRFYELAKNNPNKDIYEIVDPETSKDYKTSMRDGKVIAVAKSVSDYLLDESMVSVRIDGDYKFVRFKDADLANVLRGANVVKAEWFTKYIGGFNRMLSSLITTYDPDFVFRNFSRDIQTAVLNLYAEQDLDDGLIKDKNIVGKTVKDVYPALKTIFAVEGGWTGKKEASRNKDMDQYYKEFLEDGAKTEWFYSKPADQINKDIEKLIRGKGDNAIKAAANLVERVNSSVENAVRLSAYVNARKAGTPRAKAAELGKNLTVNFNKTGSLGQMGNTLYLFFNASVQGSSRLLRSLKPAYKIDSEGNRKYHLTRAQKMAVGLFVMGGVMSVFNEWMSDEDEDEESFFSKIPEFEKERNIIIMKPNGKDYWKIPLPYGSNVFYVAGSYISEGLNGTKTPGEVASAIGQTAIGSFSPINFPTSKDASSFFIKFILPTATQIPVAIGLNEDYFGQKIYNENFIYDPAPKPESQLGKESGYRWTQSIAKWLNEVTGGSAYRSGYIDVNPDKADFVVETITGGAGKFVTRSANVIDKILTGNWDELESRQIPFVRTFNGQPYEYSNINSFYERTVDVNQKFKEVKAGIIEGADAKKIYKMHKMGKDYKSRLKKISKLEDEAAGIKDPLKQEARLDQLEKARYKLVADFNKQYIQLKIEDI